MKLKRIIATVVAIASFASMSVVSFASTVSNAENFYTFKTEIVPATFEPGDSITINCYISAQDGEDITVGKSTTSKANFSVELPADVADVSADTDWESDDFYVDVYPKFPTVTTSVDEAANKAIISMTCNLGGTATRTYSADEPIYSIVLLTKSTAPAGTITADLNLAGCSLFDNSVSPSLSMSDAKLKVAGTATVKGTTPAGPSVSAGTVVDNVTEYTFENSTAMEGKKVLVTTAATARTAIGEDTRFYVSYQGAEPRIFGSDVWGKLAQGGGTITVNNIKFGIIVSEGLNASDFTFEVK